MSLSVGDALREGFGRTFERSGLQLIAVFVGLRLVSLVADDTLTRANLELARELDALPGGPTAEFFPFIADAPTPYALALGVSAALVLALAVAVVAEAVRIVAVRTLVGDRTDTIPAAYVTRNIAVATVNGFVGGVVVLTLTVIGLVLLVVPGVFVALSFFFVRQEIAVRDVNFVDAMAGSWELTSGDRVELFGLAAVIVLAGIVASLPGFIVGFIAPTVGTALNVIARAVVLTFGVAAAAQAYNQLREAEEEPSGDSYEGALSADDLPRPDETGAVRRDRTRDP